MSTVRREIRLLNVGAIKFNPVEGQKTQLKSSGAGGRQAGGPHSYSCLGHTNFESKKAEDSLPSKIEKVSLLFG